MIDAPCPRISSARTLIWSGGPKDPPTHSLRHPSLRAVGLRSLAEILELLGGLVCRMRQTLRPSGGGRGEGVDGGGEAHEAGEERRRRGEGLPPGHTGGVGMGGRAVVRCQRGCGVSCS